MESASESATESTFPKSESQFPYKRRPSLCLLSQSVCHCLTVSICLVSIKIPWLESASLHSLC